MSGKVQDHYTHDEFEEILDDAEMNAANDWEEEFVSDIKLKFKQYGIRMFISERQIEIIERIANGE
jgi:hypothetical protein